MNKHNIIDCLNTHSKNNPKLTYLLSCIDTLQKLENINDVFLHTDNHIIDSIRLYLLYNQDEYKIYIHNHKLENETCIKLCLGEKTAKRMSIQLSTIVNNGSMLNFNMDDDKYNVGENMFVIITKNTYKYTNIPISFDTLGYLFGYHQMYFMKHQRLDRVTRFKHDDKALMKQQKLSKFIDYLKNIDWKIRDKVMIFSGTVFETLGTTWTGDIDVLIIQENNTQEQCKKLYDDIKDLCLDIDAYILDMNNVWYCSNILPYHSIWFTSTLPKLGGAENIYEVFSNSKYHYHYMGVKMLNIDINIKRILSRFNTNSLCDVIMLERINNINRLDKICVPNMTVRQGKIKVFDDKTVDKQIWKIKDKVKLFYNKTVKYSYVSNLLKRCNETTADIYVGDKVYDPDTNIIKKNNILIKYMVYRFFGFNVKHLLDIGSGRLTDLNIWNTYNIHHVVGIEPSMDSINASNDKMARGRNNTNVELVHGIGNEDWTQNNKYKPVLMNKYDAISFQFTFHYVWQDFDIVMNNITKVLSNKTKICISCIDGKKVLKELVHKERIEVRNEHEPIFAIIPQFDANKYVPDAINNILVYFKGAHGVNSGSIEALIDTDVLKKRMMQYKFKFIQEKNYNEYRTKVYNNMNNAQKSVSGYYTSIVFMRYN